MIKYRAKRTDNDEMVEGDYHKVVTWTKPEAVERLAKHNKRLFVYLYNCGYSSGHHDTVEACYTDIVTSDMSTYHEDIVDEILAEADRESAVIASAEISQRDDEIEQLKKFNESFASSAHVLKTGFYELQAENKRLKEFDADCDGMAMEIRRLKKENKRLRQKVDALETTIKGYDVKMAEVKAENKRRDDEIMRLHDEIEQHMNANLDKYETIKSYRNVKERDMAEIKRLREVLQRIKKHIPPQTLYPTKDGLREFPCPVCKGMIFIATEALNESK